jgi:hypothetical protein
MLPANRPVSVLVKVHPFTFGTEIGLPPAFLHNWMMFHIFEDRVILRDVWPTRSANLNPAIFFSRGAY